jgi:hypothetical protein
MQCMEVPPADTKQLWSAYWFHIITNKLHNLKFKSIKLGFLRVSEECSASIIGVTRISELETMLAVTSNWRMLQENTM